MVQIPVLARLGEPLRLRGWFLLVSPWIGGWGASCGPSRASRLSTARCGVLLATSFAILAECEGPVRVRRGESVFGIFYGPRHDTSLQPHHTLLMRMHLKCMRNGPDCHLHGERSRSTKSHDRALQVSNHHLRASCIRRLST